MLPDINQLETLKYILENNLNPNILDSHPWTKGLILLEAVTDNPELEGKSPGQQLVITVAKLFTQMLPSTPPKRGKRLDTSWGEFGILAAQYFAPLLFGSPNPVSLRDAWGRIDQSILLFVFGKSEDTLTDAEKETYKLVGNELEVAPNSTISDWHRKGLLHLADVILARENYLATSLSKPAVISQAGEAGVGENDPSSASGDKDQNRKIQKSGWRRFIVPLSILIFLLLSGLKAWRIYDQVMLVRQDAEHIQELIAKPTSKMERIKEAGPALATLRQDFSKLKNETKLFFWMGPLLSWAPVYGGELASIKDLTTLADSLLTTADISYQAVAPLMEKSANAGMNLTQLTDDLIRVQPELTEAQRSLELALAARSRLTPETLSPEIRDLILNNIDPLLTLAQDGLAIGMELPRMLGATEEGPKTYLLLVQNEDELRPAGGFITAAGTLLIQDGKIGSLDFSDSGIIEDWSKPYPAAPWQLREYMNSPVLVFRDSSWFTNYPTAALYAEYLYSYTNDHSVDGVIAFDQQMLVKVLSATGPLQLEGVDYPIDTGNVISYMRDAKIQMDENGNGRAGGQDKMFMSKLTTALTDKILGGQVELTELIAVLLEALNEHHILVQVDNSRLTSVLERNHWDGAVRPEANDFLMVVDSNIGFNKTNTVVESNLSYDVDLTKPLSPTASLTVFHKNNAAEIGLCRPWDKVRAEGEQDYPITDCYWNYMRVYMKEGTKLLEATPQFVPDIWMINIQKKQGEVDILKEEIEGIQAFGTLQVLLGGQSISTNFQFALPADILRTDSKSGQTIYHLKVQKQPGTLAVPITIRVHLPKGATIDTASEGAVIENNNILYQTNLRTDMEFEIIFSLP